jgi:cold shock CspA family protein|uniref:HPF/RaiA family ribosome-associated protein n=1 Tax=Desulfobacca acetoxidans TaxID=60893 RepID=A0A7C3UWZ6_9BACT
MLPQDVHIKGRNLEILPEWREKIEEELARLQKHTYEPILHARVELIGTSHHRHGAFEIHLVGVVPGNTLTVIRQGENVLPLIVEAFEALDRRLREYSAQKQQQVKVHEEYIHRGRVARLFPEEDFGFIATPEGDEVYFHAHSLKRGAFEKLKEGVAVEFGQEEGDKGPQATWVQVVER